MGEITALCLILPRVLVFVEAGQNTKLASSAIYCSSVDQLHGHATSFNDRCYATLPSEDLEKDRLSMQSDKLTVM